MAKKATRGGESDGTKLIARNKKARHQYLILDTFEAGIALQGTEVKSLRDGKCSLAESYAGIIGGELTLVGAHIDIYKAGSYANHEPTRSRKSSLFGPKRRRRFPARPRRSPGLMGGAESLMARRYHRGKSLHQLRPHPTRAP